MGSAKENYIIQMERNDTVAEAMACGGPGIQNKFEKMLENVVKMPVHMLRRSFSEPKLLNGEHAVSESQTDGGNQAADGNAKCNGKGLGNGKKYRGSILKIRSSELTQYPCRYYKKDL